MSSILTSQITTEKNAEKTTKKETSILRELAAVFSMFAVTATVVVLTSLTWVV